MDQRVKCLNSAAVRQPARYVLYWAQMNRRVDANFGLLYAVSLANALNLPVLFYEGLTFDYPYASDRFHTFILEGVPATRRRLAAAGIGYLFYMRRRKPDSDDVLYRLAADAAAVVTDDYPTYVAARHNASVPAKIGVPYYAVDSSCIVPMSLLDKREYAAYTIRPKIRRLLPAWLQSPPPLKVRRRWTGPVPRIEASDGVSDIDHSVTPSISFTGGPDAAYRALERFLCDRLSRYAAERNEPAAHATSDLSPYLHFGHISSLEIAMAVIQHAAEHKLLPDEFLEELIVRRELAFNLARHTPRLDTLEALPDWARTTLRQHARDSRPYLYSREQFENASTHDALWNATQRELLRRGKIHGYYRMYWGKKIIEWSATADDALQTMICLHDRYALDGRDPNTYANILWCFGLHDRPWPERPVFGTIRYMSLEGMKRKTDVDAYMHEVDGLERTGKDPFRVK